MSRQTELFGAAHALPDGFRYEPQFISPDEETALLATICELPLREAQYKEWTAKRRIMSYGGRYDFSEKELLPAAPIPNFLFDLRTRLAALIEVPATDLNHALIAEYRPGTQLGWHRDVPEFEAITGLSLLGHARMRFRRYPPPRTSRRASFTLDLEPRSAYALTGPARWNWQHAISPTKVLRYSITFRSVLVGASPISSNKPS
jgi:alkylated DNA repair dioxygenase AlkB